MIHFISDLHLAPQDPATAQAFLAYLAGSARAAKQLYILGDLFEAWPGDDCLDDPEDRFNAEMAAALRDLSDAGVEVFILHGNRDFLLEGAFATRCGARLLHEPHELSLPDGQFVLAHGDALCTDDIAYQAFRTQVRAPEWRAAFLAKPLHERKTIAAALRRQSEAAKREKTQDAEYHLMDLNPADTDDFLRAHGYATFIHGHTHRPDCHRHLVDGILVERWVLSDWHDGKGECLAWDGEQLQRITIPSGT